MGNVGKMKWKAETGTQHPVHLLEIQFYCYLFNVKNSRQIFWSRSQSILLFRNWEMPQNSHFNFPCYLSISGKSESLGERDRKCLILLRYYYSSLYFLCFVHGSWVVDAFSDFFNQKFYQQQLRLVKN